MEVMVLYVVLVEVVVVVMRFVMMEVAFWW